VQIAPEHSEAVRKGAGMHMEEWLLLDWITLHAANISPWHAEPPAPIETHFAHTERALWNRTAMAARVTTQASFVKRFHKLRRSILRPRGEDGFQSRHLY